MISIQPWLIKDVIVGAFVHIRCFCLYYEWQQLETLLLKPFEMEWKYFISVHENWQKKDISQCNFKRCSLTMYTRTLRWWLSEISYFVHKFIFTIKPISLWWEETNSWQLLVLSGKGIDLSDTYLVYYKKKNTSS